MCEVLQVSRSGYYDFLTRKERPVNLEHTEKLKKVQEIFKTSYQSYGSRRISEALKLQGFQVGRYQARSLMKEVGIEVKVRKSFVQTTNSTHDFPIAPNILNRAFTPHAPNKAWGVDITYLWTKEGWLYLAVVMDFYSRRIVGWAMEEHMKSKLVEDALEMAYLRRNPSENLIHHSDRGSQYASKSYRNQLDIFDMTPSMNRKGNCWDNAPTERFFGTLKGECYNSLFPESRADAKRVVIEYIEMFYNSNRLHSTLGYLPPMIFENKMNFGNGKMGSVPLAANFEKFD